MTAIASYGYTQFVPGSAAHRVRGDVAAGAELKHVGNSTQRRARQRRANVRQPSYRDEFSLLDEFTLAFASVSTLHLREGCAASAVQKYSAA